MPLKYCILNSSNHFFITWLRHPVQRLISHYYYWSREPLPENAGVLRKKFVTERWTLNRFCLSEELRDVYSRILWGFPLRKFNFIGITEFFDEDIRFFSEQFFGEVREFDLKNFNPDRVDELYSVDKKLKEKIQEFHKRDMALYEEALLIRTMRGARSIKEHLNAKNNPSF